MPIVMISESLLARDGIKRGGTLHDHVLCGFCVKVGARTKTFQIATSVRGKALPAYYAAKKPKEASRKRDDPFFRTHFTEWLHRPVDGLRQRSFAEHCHLFAQSKGALLVELGRGVMGAVIKYVNAIHGLDLVTPFTKLAAAGLMPERAKPRLRTLEISDLPAWKRAADTLPEPQRDCVMLLLYAALRRKIFFKKRTDTRGIREKKAPFNANRRGPLLVREAFNTPSFIYLHAVCIAAAASDALSCLP